MGEVTAFNNEQHNLAMRLREIADSIEQGEETPAILIFGDNGEGVVKVCNMSPKLAIAELELAKITVMEWIYE